ESTHEVARFARRCPPHAARRRLGARLALGLQFVESFSPFRGGIPGSLAAGEGANGALRPARRLSRPDFPPAAEIPRLVTVNRRLRTASPRLLTGHSPRTAPGTAPGSAPAARRITRS